MPSQGALRRADAERLLAYERYNAGDRAGAIAALTEIVEQRPWYYDGWCTLSKFLIEEGEFARARTAAARAIACVPHRSNAHTNAGIAAREMGDLDAARAYLERAVELSPSDPIARLQLAKTLSRFVDPRRPAAAFVHTLALAQHGGFDTTRIVDECVEGLAALHGAGDFPEPLSTFVGLAVAMRTRARAVINDRLLHLSALTLSVEERQATARLRWTTWRSTA